MNKMNKIFIIINKLYKKYLTSSFYFLFKLFVCLFLIIILQLFIQSKYQVYKNFLILNF